MEPQPPDAGGPKGVAQPARPLVAPQAPATVVDSLTGALLPLAQSAAAAVPAAPASASDPAAPPASPASPPAAEPGPPLGLPPQTPLHRLGPDAPISPPGSPLAASSAKPAPPSPWQGPMPLDAEPTVLTIAGRRYAVADLPPDARALFDGIRVADLLLAQKGETCQLLRWGLDGLERQLSQKLRAVPPLPALVAAPNSPPEGTRGEA